MLALSTNLAARSLLFIITTTPTIGGKKKKKNMSRGPPPLPPAAVASRHRWTSPAGGRFSSAVFFPGESRDKGGKKPVIGRGPNVLTAPLLSNYAWSKTRMSPTQNDGLRPWKKTHTKTLRVRKIINRNGETVEDLVGVRVSNSCFKLLGGFSL